MESNPLISVIVPCYNQARYLDEAVQSVLAQTYSNWECMIVNDGSPDDTAAVAQAWCKKDPRIKYVEKPNGGLSSARNKGISMAGGEFVLPLDADDKISPEYIEGCLREFKTTPATKVVYGKAVYFGKKTGDWELPTYNYHKLLTRNLIYCTAMYRKSGWEQAGGYDETMTLGLEDWDFWLRLLSEGDVVTRIDSIVFYYRIKVESMILNLNGDNQKTQTVYNYLYQKHSEKMNRVIGSPIQLYLDYEEGNTNINQIQRGAKALGFVGRILFGILRKTGYLLLKKESTQGNGIA